MRVITPAQQAALSAASRGIRVRVTIKHPLGAWWDVSNIGGFSFLRSVSWRENVDDPHVTCDITLVLRAYQVNLSPFVAETPVNRNFDPASAVQLLVDVGREVKVEVQFGAADVSAPDPGNWMLCFHGRIDSFEVQNDSLVIGCRDLGGAIQDAFVERERAYGFNTTSGLYVWEEQRAYAKNDRIVPAGKLTGYAYKCTVAGTSGVTEPTWPTTVGATVTDGGVTWQCEAATVEGEPVESVIQKILNDAGTAVSLYTPVSPAWAVGGFVQQREPALEGIRRLAQQIGWDARYKFRQATGQFEFTLFAPDRQKSTTDRTFAPGEVKSISKLGINVDGIRNVVRVIYSDSADLAADGKTPKRKLVEVQDAASIARFGRRFMEIAEDSSSQIDSQSEATNLANAALQDLSWPSADYSVDVAFFPWAELGDYYRFQADGEHFDADQDLALVSYEHTCSISDDGTQTFSTTFQCRGKPSGGYSRWLQTETRPGIGKGHKLQQLGGAVIIPQQSVGGARLELLLDRLKDAVLSGADIHISQTANFAPNASTLVASDVLHTELQALRPGQQYFAKAVLRGRSAGQLIVGKPTPEVSFVAGQLKALHFDAELGQTPLPPNPSFESYFAPDAPPDHWEMVTGTYGARKDAYRSTDAKDGAYSLELMATASATKVRSSYFPVRSGVEYELGGWVKKVGTPTANCVLAVEWYDSAKTLLGTSSLTTGLATIGTSWTRLSTRITAPNGAVFAKVYVAKGNAEAFAFRVDALWLMEGPEAWHEIDAAGEPPFMNDWSNVGSGWETAAFCKDQLGFVHLKGLIHSGKNGQPAFTLPLGYRPAAGVHVASIANEVFAKLQILADGSVIPFGSNAWHSIHASFRVT